MAYRTHKAPKNLTDSVIERLAASPATRSQLIQELRISRTSIARSLHSLIETGHVLTMPASSVISSQAAVPGRPADMLVLQEKCGYIAGFDITKTHVHGIIVNRAGKDIVSFSQPVDRTRTWDATVSALSNSLRVEAKKHSISLESIVYVGVGLPIPIPTTAAEIRGKQFGEKPGKGREYLPPTRPSHEGHIAWKIAKKLREEWNASVLIDNDQRMVTLGEMLTGNIAEMPDMLYLSLNAGIGSCAIDRGHIIGGEEGRSGEIGHIPVPGVTTKCYCGKIGCIECEAGLDNICRNAQVESPQHLRNAYREKKPEAIAAINRAIDAIMYGVGAAILLLGPRPLVIGGALSALVPECIERMKDKLPAVLLPDESWPVPILRATYNPQGRATRIIEAVHAFHVDREYGDSRMPV